MESSSRGQKMIESLLSKPSKKPDFKSELQTLLASSNILTKAKAFMPEFVASTDKILSDPTHAFKMDIAIEEGQTDSPKYTNDLESK